MRLIQARRLPRAASRGQCLSNTSSSKAANETRAWGRSSPTGTFSRLGCAWTLRVPTTGRHTCFSLKRSPPTSGLCGMKVYSGYWVMHSLRNPASAYKAAKIRALPDLDLAVIEVGNCFEKRNCVQMDRNFNFELKLQMLCFYDFKLSRWG